MAEVMILAADDADAAFSAGCAQADSLKQGRRARNGPDKAPAKHGDGQSGHGKSRQHSGHGCPESPGW